MRLGAIPASKDRCHSAFKVGGLATRCMFKLGHNGPHEGKISAKDPYKRVEWFTGDGRSFFTDKDNEFAWIERKKNDG